MKKFKNANKGITLIALVITVIVLLILAGVALATLTGDSGILSNAEKAKEQTNLANSKEQVDLAIQGAITEGRGAITKANLVAELDKLLGTGEENYTIEPDNEVGPWTVTVTKTGYTTTISSIGKIEESQDGGSGGTGGGDGETPVAVAGKRYPSDEKIKVGNEEISMLGGFTLSGVPKESESVDKGVVAYLIPEGTTVDWTNPDKVTEAQETYDQFVWVPVPEEDIITVDMNDDKTIDTTDIDLMIAEERFPMAIANGTNEDGTTKYRAVLYDFNLSSDRTKVEVTDRSYTAESDYWEPGYLSDPGSDKETKYNNVGITTETMQNSFDAMITKVKSNGGFWVGRYETSNMVKGTAENTAAYDLTNKVTVIKGTTTGIADTKAISDGTGLNWYRMYAQQKNYATKALGISATRTSSMIWGSQWDQIMIWMRNVANDKNTANKNTFYVVNAVGMGNYGLNADETKKASSGKVVAETGSTKYYEVKNIYDLAGNVDDWTLEAARTTSRVMRGGNYYTTNTAYSRADISNTWIHPWSSETDTGSRATLY